MQTLRWSEGQPFSWIRSRIQAVPKAPVVGPRRGRLGRRGMLLPPHCVMGLEGFVAVHCSQDCPRMRLFHRGREDSDSVNT